MACPFPGGHATSETGLLPLQLSSRGSVLLCRNPPSMQFPRDLKGPSPKLKADDMILFRDVYATRQYKQVSRTKPVLTAALEALDVTHEGGEPWAPSHPSGCMPAPLSLLVPPRVVAATTRQT